MKIYKYRSVSLEDELAFERLERIIRHRRLWCARPDTLNDANEFSWTCDFTESPLTIDLVAELLEEIKGRPPVLARQIALNVIRRGWLGELGAPVIEGMIQQCREEIGVACFGTASDNGILWTRYGGNGTGVCVEFEVPDSLLGTQLHPVVYDDRRRLHVDDFLRSRNDPSFAAVVYATLLTKTRCWAPEREVRFLSKRQQIEVIIDGSDVTQVFLGSRVHPLIATRTRSISGGIPVVQFETAV